MYYQNDFLFIQHNTSKITPKLRLFCFHHSGGTAAFFRSWGLILPSTVELIAVQLSGREMRSSQPLATDVRAITKEIVDNFYAYQTVPFMFFGHSLGGLIAFEVAHELRMCHLKLPKHLIVSGRNAPQTISSNEKLHNLSDDLFIKGLEKYQGFSSEILQHKELMNTLLPRLRADFALSETYQYSPKAPLDCPIMAMGGSDDPTVSQQELAAWETQTTKKFSVNLFPGGHFFLNTYKKEVVAVILSLANDVLGNVSLL